MNLASYRDRLAGIVGNFLEHYDNALFGLLSPFIAPLFFGGEDHITALILTYCMLPLGIITRPLGSLLFGWIGDTYGRRQALFLSLCGMAITTVIMGCLPLYKDIGPWSPFSLALCRMFQGFFAAGEGAGGAIFVLEHTPLTKRSLVSSYYDAFTVAGVLLASGVVTLMSSLSIIEEGWRYLFWTGGVTAIIGIIFRLQHSKSPEFMNTPRRYKIHLFSEFKRYIRPFLGILFAAGFSYTTYAFSFTLMNGFIPLVTSLTKNQVMQVNTILLIYDMLFLVGMGHLANRLGKEKVMLSGAICAVLFAIPVFYLLEHASLGIVIAVRLAIISFGVAFAAPYYAWAIERVPVQHRYLLISLAGALGSQLIGMPTPAICLWLYKTFGWSWIPALYLQVTGVMAGLSVFLFMRKEKALVLPWK